jgi:2,3,4,5-tetrahydropyridine-2,6-dicarboxylate N-succinyltransferase
MVRRLPLGTPAMDLATLQPRIEALWGRRDALSSATGGEDRAAVEAALEALDAGRARVAEPDGRGGWRVNQWLKQAVLLSFRLTDSQPMETAAGAYDKVPLKFAGWGASRFREAGFRAVPGAVVRRSAYIAPGAVLMPSFVNVGAWVGQNTMVDTWATVGSCAQVGANVHLSGGVGIGGVLEPPQAAPVVVEDDALVGSRSMVVEGARVGRGSVLGEGVILNPGIPVIDAETGEELSRGVVPPWCVAVQAIRPRRFPGGEFGLPCVLVIRRLTPGERHDKATLNDLLRTHGVVA